MKLMKNQMKTNRNIRMPQLIVVVNVADALR